MQPRKFKAGENIITYGDFGEEYFILGKGFVNVYVYLQDTDPKDPQIHEKIAF
jgi:CRP-like cAMP-binding protein